MRWRPPPLIASPALRIAVYGGALLYLLAALATMEVNWPRVAEGVPRAIRLFSGFLRPDFASHGPDIWVGLQESITMTVTASVVGVVISIPFGVGAARNLVPVPVYVFCRAMIAFSRSLHEIVVAILLVALVGFGAFAGFLTLVFGTIGFLSKLLAEDIEDIDIPPVEAIRATGAGWWQTLVYAVLPQVAPRMIGLIMYRLDINFRESAVVGIVGAGGIGATLSTAMSRYEYGTAAAVLVCVILIVLASEYASGFIRRWAQ
jgi:phosphonate transport system permease protein